MCDPPPSDDSWIDGHSVTCAICGALAADRETIDLSDQQEARLKGEAHLDCWNDHECFQDALFAPDRDPETKADINPTAETISLPVVCKVCGRSLRLCYDFAAVYDPDADTFHSPTTKVETHTTRLRALVQQLVNADQIDPEEAQYLRDDITVLHDRLEQYTPME